MNSVERIRKHFEDHDIQRVKIGGFDIDCVLRGKYISLEKFWSIIEGDMGFCDVIFGWDIEDKLYDTSSVTGWETGYPDIIASVDLSTFRRIPWEPGTAAFLLDFKDKKGGPLEVSPRQLLKRVLERANDMGYLPTFAVEYEFFIYAESAKSLAARGFADPEPLDPGMFGYSWLRTSQSSALMQDLLDLTAAFEVPIEGFHTETGPGVFEAAIRYAEALVAADRAALFKTIVKEICHRHGVMASFMAKPKRELPGCSGHTHQSLWNKQGESVFYDENKPNGLSDVMRHYLAGQVQLLPELTALLAPNINSYKRLLGGDWAPSTAAWGIENRTCSLRVIPGSAKSTRIEHRTPGADLNPYTAIAAMIAAGLYGIEHKLEPPDPVAGNAYEGGGAPLPTSLATATERLKRSELARQLLGSVFVDHYVLTREWELKEASKTVTDWELRRYFELA